MKKTLHVKITDKVATYQQRDGNIVCGNSDYQIQFTFDSEWDAYPDKKVRFKWNGHHFDDDFSGDTCPVPIIKDALFVEVGVYVEDPNAPDSPLLETTTGAEIPCKTSILCGATTPHPESGRHYTNEAQAAAVSAKESATAAEAAANTATVAEKNARESASYILEHAGEISENSKRITNLEQGITPEPFVTDDTLAYIKDVPADACPYAEIRKVGGKVSQFESMGANLVDIRKASELKRCKFGEGDTIISNMTGGTYITIVFNASTGLPDLIKSMIGENITFSVKDTFGNGISVVIYGPRTAASNAWQEEYTFNSRFLTVKIADDFEDITSFELRLNKVKEAGYTDTTSVFEEIMLNKGAVAPYKPYRGDTPVATFPLPAEVQALEGYGESMIKETTDPISGTPLTLSVYNYIDLVERKQIKPKKNIKLSSLNWSGGDSIFTAKLDKPTKIYSSISAVVLAECSPYPVSSYAAVAVAGISGVGISGTDIIISDPINTSLTEFLDYITTENITLSYELAAPEIEDISHLISADSFIEVEGAGRIVAVNEQEQAVPTEIRYAVRG